MTIWWAMLATAATVLPTGTEWMYEVKWDGCRIIVVKDGARVPSDLAQGEGPERDYPTGVAAIAQLKPAPVVLDGEPGEHREARAAGETVSALRWSLSPVSQAPQS
jgi:hypothetical protein